MSVNGAADKLILGTVQFGLAYGINNSSGKPDFETVCEILDAAYLNGITTLDTAMAYGDAIAQISRYHAIRPHRFSVINKLGSTEEGIDLERSVIAQLKELDIPSFQAYLFHGYDKLVKNRVLLKYLTALKTSGLIGQLGISVYTNEEFEAVLDEGVFDVVQIPFNLLDNINQRGTLIGKALRLGIQIHTRSVFLQGLFFKAIDDIPPKLRPLTHYLELIRKIAKDADISVAALALQYSVRNPAITGVLVGVDNTAQLNELITCCNTPIHADVFSEVDKIRVTNEKLLNPVFWI